jgi:hypothetical protein
VGENMNVKYAVKLIYSLFPIPLDPNFNFDDSTRFFKGSLKEAIETSESKHWKEWIGSLAWDQITQDNCIILTSVPTEKPSVLDEENKNLSNKLFDVYRVLPLVQPLYYPHNEIITLTGAGKLENGELRFFDVREVSRNRPYRDSGYLRHHSLIGHEKFTYDSNPQFFGEWKRTYDLFALHFRSGNILDQLLESYRSFEESFNSVHLEFKIPNLVRSLECILGLKRGQGAGHFADRILKLLPGLLVPFPSIDIKLQLLNLYQLRSDCVHGKKIAWSLKKELKDKFSDQVVYEYEFLAETVAREILKIAMRDKNIWQYLGAREEIEEAWDQGKI